MNTNIQKFQFLFLVLFLITISCKAIEEINSSTPPMPSPSIKCDTCPEILPPQPSPPPPPPLVLCPPPPPPPCDPPPPPPAEPPCSPCMSQQQQSPPPSNYYSPPGSNQLYVTGYNAYSSGPKVHSDVMGRFVVFSLVVAVLEVIIL